MQILKTNNGFDAMVDDAVYHSLCQYNWHAATKRRDGLNYVYATINRKTVYLHRFILNCTGKEEVDHIDGNPLNNQRSNLRLCENHSLNNANCCPRRNKQTSVYKGVRLHHTGKYQAYATKKGHFYYLGLYKTPEEAALVYNRKAKELFGEYARVNVV